MLFNGILSCILLGLTLSYSEALYKKVRVAGGFKVPLGNHPYVALSLHTHIKCTAVIIDENWILGAAHCYRARGAPVEPTDVQIITGLVDVSEKQETNQLRSAKKIIVHPGFKEMILGRHDLALIELDKKLDFDNYTSPIKVDNSPFPRGAAKKCTIVGWGDVENGKTSVHLIELIVDAFHSKLACPGISEKMMSHIICVPEPSKGRGLCDGDSGGPLVCNGKLRGIAHQVYKEALAKDDQPDLSCGAEGLTHTFMHVCEYLGWMRAYSENLPSQPKSCVNRSVFHSDRSFKFVKRSCMTERNTCNKFLS